MYPMYIIFISTGREGTSLYYFYIVIRNDPLVRCEINLICLTCVFLMKCNIIGKSEYAVCNKDKQCFVKLVCENKRRGQGERKKEKDTAQVQWVNMFLFFPPLQQNFIYCKMFHQFFQLIFQLQLTYHIILVSGVQPNDQTFIYLMK